MATRTSAQHVFMFLWIIGSVAARDLKAEPGEDVLLQCHSPTGANVTKLVWSRLGLKEDGKVFFFRDNRLIEINQDPRYRGRVDLKDPLRNKGDASVVLKNGDVSVVLKNVDYDDSGTYQCEVTISSGGRRKREVTEQSINLIVIKDSEEVEVEPGANVTLQCHSPTDAAITKLKWDRPGVKGHSVFFFRDNRSIERYQDPRYHGRVELKDPQMKNGDALVVLKKVTVDDSGTYQCRVTTPNMHSKLLRSVQLIVSGGFTMEELEELVKKLLEEIHRLKVWLGVALGLVCPLVGVACFALGRYVFPKPKSGPL